MRNKLKLSYFVCFRSSDSGSVDRVPCHGMIAMSGKIIFPFSTFSLNIFELINFGGVKNTYRVLRNKVLCSESTLFYLLMQACAFL